MELAALLLACEDEHVYCASIMTGYGTFTLKKQIPRWLVQHPKVRALHQAPKEWGGEVRSKLTVLFFYIFSIVLMPNNAKPCFKVFSVREASFKRLNFTFSSSAFKIGQCS